MTNRELYLEIASFQQRHCGTERALEAYLLALWRLAQPYQEARDLAPSVFCQLLDQAFTAEPAPFQEAWRARSDTPEQTGYPGWEATLIEQVVDLREMEENGQLANPHRYFGIDAPRGQRWYNFDPLTFVECATVGKFEGWEPGDDTGRFLLDGSVLTMDEAGQLVEGKAHELPRPVFPIPAITWNDFRDFLHMGQLYE